MKKNHQAVQNFKTYLKENGIRTRALAQKTGIPYSTLNDIVNGKTDIEQVRLGIVKKICNSLQLTIDELCDMCSAVRDEKPLAGGSIHVKNKRYYLLFQDGEKEQERYLCKVNPLNTKYVRIMAEWELEEIRMQEELKAWRNDII